MLSKRPHHDGGHEEAAGDGEAAVEGHEDEVGGAQHDERVQREVAVLALAHLVLRVQKQLPDSLGRFQSRRATTAACARIELLW